MTAVWALYHEELCSDGVVAPHVRAPMGAPHRWGAWGRTPFGVSRGRRPRALHGAPIAPL